MGFPGKVTAETTTQPPTQLHYRPSPPGVTNGAYKLCRRYLQLLRFHKTVCQKMIKMCEKFGNAFTLHPDNKNITVFIIMLVTLRESLVGGGKAEVAYGFLNALNATI